MTFNARAVLMPCVAALVTLGGTGCVLDFGQFQGMGGAEDAHVVVDLGAGADTMASPDGSDLSDAVDAPGERDLPTVLDVECPAQPTRVRLAHLAETRGPLDLCMARVSLVTTAVRAGIGVWPDAGVQYGEVTAPVETPIAVTTPREVWNFFVVPHDAPCRTATPIATLQISIDPGEQTTLLLTRQTVATGQSVIVLGLLPDIACAGCGSAPEVRAIHAAFGWAVERVTFSLVANATGPLLQFAQNVPYGDTMSNDLSGYNCVPSWQLLLGAMPPPVRFVAQDSSGHELARSTVTTLQPRLLRSSDLATVFFEGDVRADAGAAFLLCYDGALDAGLTQCERMTATATLSDGGRGTVDGGVPDGAPVDARTSGTDAGVTDFDGALDAAIDRPMNPDTNWDSPDSTDELPVTGGGMDGGSMHPDTLAGIDP